MNSEPDWTLYRSFIAVVQEGSLSRAARRLGLTQPTLTRHVDVLEEAIGVTLFLRTQRGLAPTDVALKLVPLAESMAATAAALGRMASDDAGNANGTVRVSASEIVCTEYLPTICAGLRRSHPGLVIEILLTNQVTDLLQHEADIAVRMKQPVQESLIACRLPPLELGLYAHRDYLAHRPAPLLMTCLSDHDVIGYDTETPMRRAMARRFPAYARSSFALRTDSDNVQLASLRAGCGIGICHTALAKRDPMLVRVLPDLVSIELEMWIVMHEDLRSRPACKTVFDALVKSFRCIER